MLVNKRTLVVFNVEYELPGTDGKPVTWKANILCSNNHADAIGFIRHYTGKPVTVLSISKITELDAITDIALDYIAKKSGIVKVEAKKPQEPAAPAPTTPEPTETNPEKKKPGRPPTRVV